MDQRLASQERGETVEERWGLGWTTPGTWACQASSLECWTSLSARLGNTFTHINYSGKVYSQWKKRCSGSQTQAETVCFCIFRRLTAKARKEMCFAAEGVCRWEKQYWNTLVWGRERNLFAKWAMHLFNIKQTCLCVFSSNICTGGGSLLREGEAALLEEASEVGLAWGRGSLREGGSLSNPFSLEEYDCTLLGEEGSWGNAAHMMI